MGRSRPVSRSTGYVLFFGLISPLLAGCAPDVQQSLRQAQHAEVMKLTAGQNHARPDADD